MKTQLCNQTTFHFKGKPYIMQLDQVVIHERMKAMLPKYFWVSAGFDATMPDYKTAECRQHFDTMVIAINPLLEIDYDLHQDIESVRRAYASKLAHEFCHVTQYGEPVDRLHRLSSQLLSLKDRWWHLSLPLIIISVLVNSQLILTAESVQAKIAIFIGWTTVMLSIFALPHSLYFYSPLEIKARQYSKEHWKEWLEVITIKFKES